MLNFRGVKFLPFGNLFCWVKGHDNFTHKREDPGMSIQTSSTKKLILNPIFGEDQSLF